jgi:DNA-binding Lrp family transcriptional regulator
MTQGGSVPVVTAYILIQTEVGKAAQVAKEIVEIKGVQQAEAVAGPYDVIVHAEARNIDELSKLVVAPRAGGRRHHQDAHLPGGAPLELRV